MSTINKVCFAVCMLCIVGATAVSILAIWNVVENEALLWRSLATLGVVFLAGILTTTVNRMYT